jgi:hypothetical protein
MGSVNSGFSGTQIWGNDGNGNFAFSDNNGSIYTTSPGTPDTGLLVLSRTASNSLKGYSGTTLIGTDTNGAISMLNQNVFVLGRNYDGTFGRTSAGAEAALWFHGRGLSGSEIAALNGRVLTLKVAIGW